MTDAIKPCPHDIAERETAVADGMCPRCPSPESERVRDALERIANNRQGHGGSCDADDWTLEEVSAFAREALSTSPAPEKAKCQKDHVHCGVEYDQCEKPAPEKARPEPQCKKCRRFLRPDDRKCEYCWTFVGDVYDEKPSRAQEEAEISRLRDALAEGKQNLTS